jgi:hypothetical protein
MKKFLSYKILCAAFAGTLFSTSLMATTYYVSPNGSDNAAGTSASTAWQTISKINSLAIAPGTTILFEGGKTFNGGLDLNNQDGNDPSNNIIISSYGTGKAIISSGVRSGLYAYNTQGITISNLIFEGSGMSTNTADGVLFFTDLSGNVKLSKINIQNVEVHNYGKTGISISSSNGNTGFKDVVMDGVHVYQVKQNGIITVGHTAQTQVGWAHQNVTIKNTEVNNVTGYADPTQHRGSGIILGQVDNGLIEKTVAHDNGAGNTHCGGPGGIWAWDCNNVTIQYCESYSNKSGTGCDGLGFDLDGGMTNSIMQYNYSHDNDGAGYLLGQFDYARPWSNNIVRYNISENDGRTNAGGITLFKGAGTTMAGIKIYNNTIYTSPSATNAGVGAFTLINWNTGITGVDVYNNIFQTTGGVNLIDIPAGYTAKFSGNLYWTSGAAFKIKYQGATYSNLAAWRTATGNEQTGANATGVTADPLLKNAGHGGIMYPSPTTQLDAYKLGAGSPAIDAGLDLLSLFSINIGGHDFFNNATQGTIADIGVHEASPAVTTGIAAEAPIGEEKISFFPNPAKSGSPISVKGAALPYSAEIVSITGASVWKNPKIESKEYTIPTVTLAAGPYLLLIKDSNGQKKVNKVIIDN